MVKPTSVSPFTLAMIPSLFEDQDNECLKLPDGRMVGTVKLVGRIENLEDREGFRAILFDDSTGYRVIRDYKETQDQTKIKQGDYVSVFGSCKVAKGGNGIFFNAFEIKKLDETEKYEGDHVSAHLIEVVVAHLRKKHGADVANVQAAASGQQMPSKPVAAKIENFDDCGIPGATPDQQKVLAIVKGNDTEEGANISSDFNHLGLSKDKLQETLNWLSDEGHIYSTIDDDHFKTT